MSEVILVVLRKPETAPVLLDAAKRLAELNNGARVNALAVKATPSALAAEEMMREADAVLLARQQEHNRVADLMELFRQWSSRTGVAARWIETEGDATAIIGERGSRADIIVIDQPTEDDRLSRQAFRAALFATDRPVLMMPPSAPTSFGHRVAIAWRDEKRAAGAVIPALRCLSGSERVHVLMGVREGAIPPSLPKILSEHGVRAELHLLPLVPGQFGERLLRKAHELGADMLVMGAYAHSPLRELILGGVTRYMLLRADLPVFMRH